MTLESIVAGKAWVGAAVFAALFAGERLLSASPWRSGAGRLVRNGVMWAMLLALSPLIVLPLTAWAGAHALWVRPEDWPALATLAADIVLLDLWAYWVHRAYHETALWRLHRVHHLDGQLDTTTAVRFHPGEVALSALFRIVPIVVLAIPFNHVVIFEAALLSASLFHHSNLRLPRRFEKEVSRVVVTPSIHWVHHHARREDINSNYAAVFSAWDPLFGTKSGAARTPDMKIGVPGVEDKSVIGLILLPFQKLERR